MRYPALCFVIRLLWAAASPTPAAAADFPDIFRLPDGETRQVNSLWGENPKELQFGNGRGKVVIADLQGPGIITMIHFALPQTMTLNRDTVLRIYWDGEKSPSVQAPLVDFFLDPDGRLERVDSALVNKKRGWNCYFPMPFARSARLELSYDNPRYPSGAWEKNPCYAYVHYRTVKALPAETGNFHAFWRQRTVLLGKEPYPVFEARGAGRFIGWNVSLRGVGTAADGYPVDENVDFYIDGEKEPSISWQGIEDSFGFSWGFPEQANSFPYTGYQPWMNGAAAYRLTLADSIAFRKSLRMAVEFGGNEAPVFHQQFSQPRYPLQFSSVAYWYQKEPHAAFEPMPPPDQRRPVSFDTAQKPPRPGETLSLLCGRLAGDIEFLAPGWDFMLRSGYLFEGPPWTTELRHCWADFDALRFDIVCPKGAAGVLRLYILDGDSFAGGRRQSIAVCGKPVGTFENFQTGRWVEANVTAAMTQSGRFPVVVANLKPGANAVVSLVRFQKAE